MDGISSRPWPISEALKKIDRLGPTEGVINALKHAFPRGEPNGRIIVTYDANGADWKLSIADNGAEDAAALGYVPLPPALVKQIRQYCSSAAKSARR